MMATTTNIVRGKQKYQYDYKLDVISNGSELTEPTVFLTVSRRSPITAVQFQPLDDDGDDELQEEEEEEEEDTFVTEDAVVARYALLGLSDMTARLVADQKISWANIKAVFCHNNNDHAINGDGAATNGGGGGMWGLPGLLIALHQAGAPKLTVVTGNEEDASRAEALVELLEVYRSYPQVHISAVPFVESNSSAKDTTTVIWWQTYQDDYLVVHATCYGSLENLIYLFTCRQHTTTTTSSSSYTIAVLPSICAGQVFLDLWRDQENRVVLETEDGDNAPLNIHVILTVNDDDDQKDTGNLQRFVTNAKAQLSDTSILVCRPAWKDDGILLRAQNLSQTWHNALPNSILWNNNRQSNNHQSAIMPDTESFLDVKSCSTVILEPHLKMLDRKRAILQRMRPITLDQQQEDVKRLHDFLKHLPATPTQTVSSPQGDMNEIDIDDDEEAEDTAKDDNKILVDLDSDRTAEQGEQMSSWTSCPHLLVLGTGCAAPSPVRGSSGYGLLFLQQLPDTQSIKASSKEALLLTAIIECGEGTLTMLLRHLPPPGIGHASLDSETQINLHLRMIKFIWISHAHWDHYGGLPALLKAIHRARQKETQWQDRNFEEQSKKRPRTGPLAAPPVCVIAPTKVLKYLDVALRCRRGVLKDINIQLFHGCNPEHVQSWWPYISSIEIARASKKPNSGITTNGATGYGYRPFIFWENVRVHHSCFKAYGFVMGLRMPSPDFDGDFCTAAFNQDRNNSSAVTFAYSGDTRPCWKLVERCTFHCNIISKGGLSFLLHEASFSDDEKEMSIEKKHSTLSEAIQVGADVGAEKVLLTHFSQRYDKYPAMKIPADTPVFRNQRVAFALDGLLVPLT